MKTGIRILAVVVSLAMLLSGPLAPLATAQQPAPTEPAPTQPAPSQPMPDASSRESGSVAYNIGAAAANVVHVPGKAALCFLGTAAGVFVLLVSVGSAPKTAAGFANEGCGGKWILTGDDLRPDADARVFDWEKDRSY